ncbi:MAG: hypothetical protein ACFFHD_04080 [Promethearchaeota archaeon]
MKVNAISKDKTISLLKISLSKSGGAIHGIGEKFATNPVMATGLLTFQPLYYFPILFRLSTLSLIS